MKTKFLGFSLLLLSLYSCNSNGQTKKLSTEPKPGKAIAVFAEGCFWCSEHVFEAIAGVDEAVSGYTGGTTKNPSYEQVGGEQTGHAESVLVYYDPKVVSYSQLVDAFFASQDPTTPNQQGPDRGPSYRSIAFYRNEAEKSIIKAKISELERKKVFSNPIVTEIKPLSDFYKAEDYHQNYIKLHSNGENPYVTNVSIPRYELFKKTFKGKLKAKS
ncbi:peptide-methionine (S)-S-oxide reductase MsrA [Flavobacterium soyangense]|uniref:Peptide methionine sulfoxide reductase MsrA n=1 Tax=Flavobacterium soyangense TaxID=2023265 RepID=A0A930U9T9_9FLAO|nr:peptide-methionine (S)-S-oxide reductase MsrA [Flavobacterium soyangense]MBF2709598.1 peptide-methionine (S)-S-oxide reductase MsrA [Flavobacterium soyangense]